MEEGRRPPVVVERLSQDYVYGNMHLFNTNNLWAEMRLPKPEGYHDTLKRAMTKNWIDPNTVTVTFLEEDIQWMVPCAKIGMVTGRASKLHTDQIEEIAKKYPIPGEGNIGWFVRTETVSLKYGMHGKGPYRDMKSIIESLVSSADGHMCISESDDLTNYKLYFIPWVDIVQEFRVFVYNNRISAISTQHFSAINEWLQPMTDTQVATAVVYPIVDYFEGGLKQKLAPIVGPNYTMDIAFLKDGSVYFIEPNSFGANMAAGSAAFHWVYEHDKLHRESDDDAIFVKFTSFE